MAPHNEEDLALSRRAAAGDRAAFAMLVEKHERPLRSFLARAAGPDLADDIVSRTEAAILSLTDFPRLGAIVDTVGARKWPVPRTPFILLYDVGDGRIELLSVSYARKDWAVR